jgi:hypothetical protein
MSKYDGSKLLSYLPDFVIKVASHHQLDKAELAK